MSRAHLHVRRTWVHAERWNSGQRLHGLRRCARSFRSRSAYSILLVPNRSAVPTPPPAPPFDVFEAVLRVEMITVQVNGNSMARACRNLFGSGPNLQTAYCIETFAWDESGDLLIGT